MFCGFGSFFLHSAGGCLPPTKQTNVVSHNNACMHHWDIPLPPQDHNWLAEVIYDTCKPLPLI